jgi:predicted pyridoxine 5'-phosphate oxidase superfamily flavin-nucleotide-binding protein
MSDVDLRALTPCFEGAVPAVVATANADGVPNVTYLSRVRCVDNERIALSNQFFSKTARNLAENPRASILIINPITYDEFRLTVLYERTERRGAVFEQLADDVNAVAALHHMEDVFKLRAADIYRVLHVDQLHPGRDRVPEVEEPTRDSSALGPAQLGELVARLNRCTDLNAIVATTVAGLAELLDFQHCLLLLVDEDGKRLYTIASHGYEAEGVGSEVVIGEGLIGMAAARVMPMRLGNLVQMRRYGEKVRAAYEELGEIGPGREIPVPGLPDAESRIAVPAVALGQLVGVLVVDSAQRVAFSETDESLLSIVASLVANAIEVERANENQGEPAAAPRSAPAPPGAGATHVRFFPVDGSTFLDGDYLIKGVAGRILWSLLRHYTREQRVDFTNKEVRLDPSLELPEFRDNLDSRLLLLKRRLDERSAPIRIEKTGRGRFRLVVDTMLRLDEVAAPDG